MTENTTAGLEAERNVFTKMLLLQLAAITVTAIAAYIIAGLHAALSIFAGGLPVIIGAFLASKIAYKKSNTASTALMRLLAAEGIKILVIIVLLFLVYKLYSGLVPFALITGLVVAAMLSGIAISKINKQVNNIQI